MCHGEPYRASNVGDTGAWNSDEPDVIDRRPATHFIREHIRLDVEVPDRANLFFHERLRRQRATRFRRRREEEHFQPHLAGSHAGLLTPLRA